MIITTDENMTLGKLLLDLPLTLSSCQLVWPMPDGKEPPTDSIERNFLCELVHNYRLRNMLSDGVAHIISPVCIGHDELNVAEQNRYIFLKQKFVLRHQHVPTSRPLIRSRKIGS